MTSTATIQAARIPCEFPEIDWHYLSTENPPDTERNVTVAFADAEQTFPAFYHFGQWYWTTGTPILLPVVCWREFPGRPF